MKGAKKKQLVVIGGGPAGLAAALAAKRSGISDILILERDEQLGGILNQCIHNGFGLHSFHEELTGPEYASRYIEQIEQEKIDHLLDTMVIDLDHEKNITFVNQNGVQTIHAQAIILAMGCRERPRGALNIPVSSGWNLLCGNSAETCQHRRIHARKRCGHSRVGRYRADHGKKDAPGRCQCACGRRDHALFGRIETQHCAVSG